MAGSALFSIGGGSITNVSGNLFYFNRFDNNSDSVLSGNSVSGGYNVVDSVLNSSDAGFTGAEGDKSVLSHVSPVSPYNYNVITDGAADGVLPSPLPTGYPTTDFYGNPINPGGAAGAVQTAENGRYLIVFNPTDPDNNTTIGTLRHALTSSNHQDGDIIYFEGVIPGSTQIAIANSDMPQITKNIRIEGNGITLTRQLIMPLSSTSQLLRTSSAATVHVSRIYFLNGRTTLHGGAINNGGTLTLESCIFSGNRPYIEGTQDRYGGAIYNTGSLTVRGCTFYDNGSYNANNGYIIGGTIYSTAVTGTSIILCGNLFYRNYSFEHRNFSITRGGTTTSLGYNVVDREYGTSSIASGFTPVTGDANFANTGFADNYTDPFTTTSGTTAFTLRLGNSPANNTLLHTHIPAGEWAAENMPETDFYGNVRTWPGAPGAVR